MYVLEVKSLHRKGQTCNKVVHRRCSSSFSVLQGVKHVGGVIKHSVHSLSAIVEHASGVIKHSLSAIVQQVSGVIKHMVGTV